MLAAHAMRATMRPTTRATCSIAHSAYAAVTAAAPCATVRCLTTATRAAAAAPATPPTPAAAAASPPPMELPSFLSDLLGSLRRRFIASPNAQAMQLYHFALRNPLGRPASSSAAKSLPALPLGESLGLLSLRMPDDELTRYRLVGLHLWMLQKVLLTSLAGPEVQRDFIHFLPPSAPLPLPSSSDRKRLEYLFEHFWADLTPYLKEARGEMKLTKTMKSVQEYFYGAFVTMDMAWVSDASPAAADAASASPTSTPSPFAREFLAAALWRNYYMGDPNASKRDVYRLVYYMQRQMVFLSQLPKNALWLADDSLAEVEWLPNGEVFHRSTGALSDQTLAAQLGITPAAWSDPSFETWKEKLLEGQTFDTRLKSYNKNNA